MSFYVTLPSNSSSNLFSNSISNFTTQLHVPIRLSGQYEVALVEFSYDHYWSVNLGILKYIHSDNVVFEVEINHRDGDQIETLIDSLNESMNVQLIAHEMKKIRQVSPHLSDKEIRERVIQGFMKKRTYNDEDNEKVVEKTSWPFIKYIKEKRHLVINTISDQDHYRFEGYFSDLFGLNNFLINSKSPPIKLSNKYEAGLFVVNAMYIYTDIIQYQYIGDTLAPLLRNVNIPTNTSLNSESVIYDSPHYIPVNKSAIDTINIKIKDEQGNSIRFERGKSIVKLHFRPVVYGF